MNIADARFCAVGLPRYLTFAFTWTQLLRLVRELIYSWPYIYVPALRFNTLRAFALPGCLPVWFTCGLDYVTPGRIAALRAHPYPFRCPPIQHTPYPHTLRIAPPVYGLADSIYWFPYHTHVPPGLGHAAAVYLATRAYTCPCLPVTYTHLPDIRLRYSPGRVARYAHTRCAHAP